MNNSSLLWASAKPPSLNASRHIATGEIFFPAVSADSSLSNQFSPCEQSVEGEVYSFTIIHPSAKSGLPPFALAYVNLPGPLRLFGRLLGAERPCIGQRCRVVPDDTYGFVFESMEALS
jgi:uncharacterized OB-fold protein